MTTETQTTEAATTAEGATTTGHATQQSATGAEENGQQHKTTEARSEQVGAAKTDSGPGEKPEGAPDNYEFKPPEGKEFSPEVLGAFSKVARELNLTNAQAQTAIDTLAPAFAAREAAAMEAAREAWVTEANNDTEFGGDKFAENLAIAKKAVDAFASPELRALLEESGMGDHPEVIRLFYRAGKAISEDRFVSGQPGKTNQGDARRLYSASNMNP